MSDTCPYCKGTGKIEATFASRLVSLRSAKGVTQQDVSLAIGLSRPQIANLEIGRGEPSVTTLINLASYFDCSTDYLLGRAALNGGGQ